MIHDMLKKTQSIPAHAAEMFLMADLVADRDRYINKPVTVGKNGRTGVIEAVYYIFDQSPQRLPPMVTAKVRVAGGTTDVGIEALYWPTGAPASTFTPRHQKR